MIVVVGEIFEDSPLEMNETVLEALAYTIM